MDTVVLDGNCDLIVEGSVAPVIDVIADGEIGIETEVYKIPSNYGKITWTGSVLTVT